MERQIKISKQTAELINAVVFIEEAWDTINLSVEDYTNVRNGALELVKKSIMFNLKSEGDTITI